MVNPSWWCYRCAKEVGVEAVPVGYVEGTKQPICGWCFVGRLFWGAYKDFLLKLAIEAQQEDWKRVFWNLFFKRGYWLDTNNVLN